ncbi:unnamed protein product [Owenia fusiformis]|uniref:Uncharacterized protein n=1 Tax=Owenia fusiformis TaxID=6347 RepID=A0A8J1TW54_OWEFU|nr:unnamed protein product [Owenia fusiformis]
MAKRETVQQCLIIYVYVLLRLIREICCEDLHTDYMTLVCNSAIGGINSGRLETSTSITYDNEMDCATRINIAATTKMYLQFKRFELEEKLLGKCVDGLDVYDGPLSPANRLTPETLCDTVKEPFNFTTSGPNATIKFFSDSNAVFKGFEIVYIAFSNPPCGADYFACGHGEFCVPADLECDDYDQCGDGSDEALCTEEDIIEKENRIIDYGIMVGVIIAVLLLILILIYVAYRLYQYYALQKLLRSQPKSLRRGHFDWIYPITVKYSKYHTRVKKSKIETVSTEQEVTTVTETTTEHAQERPLSALSHGMTDYGINGSPTDGTNRQPRLTKANVVAST